MRKKDVSAACIIFIFILSFLLCAMIFKFFIIPHIQYANEYIRKEFVAYCVDKLKECFFDFKTDIS